MTDLELYNKAKEAYYNGTPIMEDFEFDELEKKLGLENKSYIGTHKNPTYTVKHPIIMGSLSKVQIKEKDGSVDWDGFASEISKYMSEFKAGSMLPKVKAAMNFAEKNKVGIITDIEHLKEALAGKAGTIITK